jgi:muconate cycloisomerase
MILMLRSLTLDASRHAATRRTLSGSAAIGKPAALHRRAVANASNRLTRFANGLAYGYGLAFDPSVARMSDAPIAAIELHHVALPTRREHKWTGLTEPIGGYVLVKMIDAAGAVGWGEAPALKDWGGDFGRYFGESPATTIEIITRYLTPAVKGCMPGEIGELHARMDRSIKGYPYAKAAVEFAAYDLAGRQWGLPVHRLLGGAVRRRIPVTHSIGLMAAEEAEREVAQVAKEGICTIKIKVGVDPDRDVDMVRRVRETVGPGIALCVDANQGYRTPGEAIRTYRRMERFELIYFEQPVEGIQRLAEVARAIDAPVMADESAWNAHDIIEIIEKRAAQIVSIYTTKPGGLYAAFEVQAENCIAFAEARRVAYPVVRPADGQGDEKDLAATDFQAGFHD